MINILKKRKKIISAFLVAGFIASLFSPLLMSAESFPRDFDANAVMYGGAFSKTEILDKINNGDGKHNDLKQIYYGQNRSITEQGIKNSTEGFVNKNGTVESGGKVVAKDVFSSGRSFIPGSTKDGSIWMRPPSVSFISDHQSAFVIMEGGAFKAAILKSCGNPIKVLSAPFPQVYKRVLNERTGVETDADTEKTAIKAREGDKLKFTVTVTNQGTAAAEGVFVKDTLPQGLNLSDPNRRDASMNVGTVDKQNKKFFFIIVTAAKGTAGKCLENKAIMTANGGFKDQDSAWVCVEKSVVPPTIKQKITIIKFEDLNHDGIKNSGEKVLPNFKFKLNDVTKTTNNSGTVVFDNVSVGSHKIEEVDIPTNYVPTNQNPFTVNVKAGKDETRLFGNQKKAIVQNEQNIKVIKFEDIDHDGKKGDNEKFLQGFTFQIDGKETKVSDKNGVVIFSKVTAGKHIIKEINIPKDFIPITENPLGVNVPTGKTIIVIFGNQKLVPEEQPPKQVKPEIKVEEEAAVEVPVAVAGEEAITTKGGLPAAGPEDAFAGILGSGMIGYAGYFYRKSRRKLLSTLRSRKS